MRLTLRTLLSYLDDTLEPAQAKIIGAKLAENEQAQELVQRIKQVTRRRRQATPQPGGPGGIDPNTIAEYLDNEVSAEQAAEFEQICLASDVHLGEVAACHQILTLVLGEPALVPPAAKQRMYALVKGPEAIPSRKPGKVSNPDMDVSSAIEPDADVTLRLGMPAVGGVGSRNLWIMLGSGAFVTCLLVVAIWMLVRPAGTRVAEPKGFVHVDRDREKEKDNTSEPAKDDKKKNAETNPPLIKVEEFKLKIEDFNPKIDYSKPKAEEFKSIVEVPPAKLEAPAEVKYQPADPKQIPIGQCTPPNVKEPALLLQATADKMGWERVGGKTATVFSGRPLLSLPGSKNVVNLDSGIELTLWGNLPERTLDPVLFECSATIHATDTLATDVTLRRGRLVIRNAKDDKDVRVRVRFEDHKLGKENHFDIVLHGQGAAVALERHGVLGSDEPFFPNPDDSLRKGPTGIVSCYAYGNSADVCFEGVAFTIDQKSQPLLLWQSRLHELAPPKQPFLPYWLKGIPPLKDADLAAQRDAVKAHENLVERAQTKPIDVALTEYLRSSRQEAQKDVATTKQIAPATFAKLRHAIHCYAALDDIDVLFNEFTQDATLPVIRGLCMETLYAWLGLERDHDYRLLEVVAKRHLKTPAIKIMELFHRVSAEDAQNPLTYQHLIEGMNNNLMPIRLLSYWHLFALVPAGRGIQYDPAAPARLRQAAVEQWTKLIPPGKLPPMKK